MFIFRSRSQSPRKSCSGFNAVLMYRETSHCVLLEKNAQSTNIVFYTFIVWQIEREEHILYEVDNWWNRQKYQKMFYASHPAQCMTWQLPFVWNREITEGDPSVASFWSRYHISSRKQEATNMDTSRRYLKQRERSRFLLLQSIESDKQPANM